MHRQTYFRFHAVIFQQLWCLINQKDFEGLEATDGFAQLCLDFQGCHLLPSVFPECREVSGLGQCTRQIFFCCSTESVGE